MKALAWTLRAKSSPWTVWHCPHTLPTHDTPGGAAPWLPWQSLQVGADRSPFASMVFQWTLALYLATWSMEILYPAMCWESAWQPPQVSATLNGWTVELGSDGGRMLWAG